MSLNNFHYFFSIVLMGQVRNQVLLDKIGAKVKRLRESAHVTQEQFYFDTGVHIGRVETGKTNLTISTLDSICQYFGTSVEDFFKDI